MADEEELDEDCVVCARGFHEECLLGCSEHPEEPEKEEDQDLPGSYAAHLEASSKRKKGATYDGLKDPKSTGRKRAARLYPLNSEEHCEWRGKKNCGGGKRPIIGCTSGLQQARHHGPVKNTTRNHEGNVHRICARCHNHWHELNDLVYDEADYALLPHDPLPATDEELVADELEWITGKIAKKFKLASTENMNKSRID